MKALLKSARESKNLNTRTLAQLVGIDQALISKFENGSRNPTKNQINKLAEVLEIDLEMLTITWLKQKIITTIGLDSLAVKAMKITIQEFEKNKDKPQNSAAPISQIINEIEGLKRKLNQISKEQFEAKNKLAAFYFTYDSNLIHGNSFSLLETKKVLFQRENIAGKSMQEHLEITNHQTAIEYLKQLVENKENLNENDFFKLHNILLRGIAPDNLDRYREEKNPDDLKSKMKAYFEWYLHFKTKIHPILLACQMHEKLAVIQPFETGNGRLSRLILQFILLQNGYLIANSNGDIKNLDRYSDVVLTNRKSANIEPLLYYVSLLQKECLLDFLTDL